jgi:hypothetical protein
MGHLSAEAKVGMLIDVEGLDTIELGCGTGYVSAWLARRGARPVGLDNSPVQLATARQFQSELGLPFPLIQGNAGRTPFPDRSFDYAISEYGAAIWWDPYAWIPEAARSFGRAGGSPSSATPTCARSVHRWTRMRPWTSACTATTSACTASTGRRTSRPSSISRMASGSACFAPTGSRSRTSRSCRRPMTPPPLSSGSPWRGHADGRTKRSGRPASVQGGQATVRRHSASLSYPGVHRLGHRGGGVAHLGGRVRRVGRWSLPPSSIRWAHPRAGATRRAPRSCLELDATA